MKRPPGLGWAELAGYCTRSREEERDGGIEAETRSMRFIVSKQAFVDQGATGQARSARSLGVITHTTVANASVKVLGSFSEIASRAPVVADHSMSWWQPNFPIMTFIGLISSGVGRFHVLDGADKRRKRVAGACRSQNWPEIAELVSPPSECAGCHVR